MHILQKHMSFPKIYPNLLDYVFMVTGIDLKKNFNFRMTFCITIQIWFSSFKGGGVGKRLLVISSFPKMYDDSSYLNRDYASLFQVKEGKI